MLPFAARLEGRLCAPCTVVLPARAVFRKRPFSKHGTKVRSRHGQPLLQLVDQDALVFRIVDRHDHQMDAATGEGCLKRRQEVFDCLHPCAFCAIGFGVGHEVRVTEGHAEVGEAVDRLFPPGKSQDGYQVGVDRVVDPGIEGICLAAAQDALNCMANTLIVAKAGEPAFNASTFRAWSGESFLRGFAHSAAAMTGEGIASRFHQDFALE